MTEKDKMIKGLRYLPDDSELVGARLRARKPIEEISLISIDGQERRKALFGEVFAKTENDH